MRHQLARHLISIGIVSCALGVGSRPVPARCADPPFGKLLGQIRPKTPAQALDAFQVRPGFRVELVAAEPLVQDPIAIDWGPDGTLWVVEMGGYPTGYSAAGGARGGRIRCLEDVDGDGRYDRARTFLDGLAFPTGVMAWRDGVLVTCAPDIFYAEDTNGDGRADRRRVLYHGFVEGNPQHRVNGLRWGIDNWIYVANGDSGGRIQSAGGPSVDIHGRDLRIRPGSGALQTATGMAQFGRCRDDWGNWFGGRNLQPIWHCVLPDHYLRRNPYLRPPDPCVDLLDPPTAAPVYPISPPLPRFNELWAMNRFTAACGITVYRDRLFGPSFAQSCFICEPAYNLVFHGTLQRNGVTFTCQRDKCERRREFLASRDNWFRPVQARTGPDGALWVVDMYRLVIEHPDYIPKRWHSELDFQAGSDRGRIYRILPRKQRRRSAGSLMGMTTTQLVAALATPNGPRRDLVHQRLLRRRDDGAIEPLTHMATAARLPAVRISALAVLDGMDAATDAVLATAMRDHDAFVRRQAVRISERRLADSASLQQAVLGRVTDTDVMVRLQVALSLGQWPDQRAAGALAKIATRDAHDPFVTAAVLSSATSFPGPLLHAVLALDDDVGRRVDLVQTLLRLCWDAAEYGALANLFERITARRAGGFATWQLELLADWADILRGDGAGLEAMSRSDSPRLRRLYVPMTRMVTAAGAIAMADDTTAAQRVQAVRLVGRLGSAAERRRASVDLASLITPQHAPVVQQAAVAQIGLLAAANSGEVLLGIWEVAGPEQRAEILEILLRDERGATRLLDAIDADDVSPQEIGAVYRNRLLLNDSVDVSTRAARIFASMSTVQVAAAMRRYTEQLATGGDARRGREVFEKHCATCHQLEGVGTNVGPDLLALTDRSTETLLVALLDPNQSVAPRYVEYSALTVRGRIVSGVIVGETGNSIKMVDAQGAKHELVRSDIDELVSSRRSLMPEGLVQLFERDTDVRDLVKFLQSLPAPRPGANVARFSEPK